MDSRNVSGAGGSSCRLGYGIYRREQPRLSSITSMAALKYEGIRQLHHAATNLRACCSLRQTGDLSE